MSVSKEDLTIERIDDGYSTEEVEKKTKICPCLKKGESFQDLYEESLQEIQEGGIVHGRVIHIGAEFVTVDIGLKSEGQVAMSW